VKKVKDKQEDKENKITFKDLWHHPIYNPLIKLGMWGIFFLVIYIFIFIGSSSSSEVYSPSTSTTTTKAPSKISFSKMKDNLISKEQSVVYQIDDYYITGIISEGVLNATVEIADETYKIKYDGENLYQVKRDEETINNELLTSINLDYLLAKNIIEVIDEPKVIGTKSADEKSYSYVVDDKAISVYFNDEVIDTIIILDNGITYDLDYQEVGD
jgi:hypothetical protein